MIAKCKNGGGILSNTHKGFTLIELLAVIVILAVIALIATPIILNMIESAKKSAAKDSAYGYIDAIEKNNLLSEFDMDNKYQIIEDGEEIDVNTVEVDVKGSTPSSGTITIEKGLVTEAELCINNYKVKYNGQVAEVDGKCNGTIEYKKYENGTAIYYNPIEGKICTDYKEANSKTGTKTGCMKFYTFNDEKTSSTVNMILDHNTTALVAYNSTGVNTEMKEVKTALESDTTGWKGSPRLITADEIAEITGAKEVLSWTSDKTYASTPEKGTSISYFYLDGADGTDALWHTQIAKTQGSSNYAWLYDNTYGCTKYGCNISDDNKYEYGTTQSANYMYGYWTSTPVIGLSHGAWYVDWHGYLTNYYSVDIGYNYGVRPVITVSKKSLEPYKETILNGTDPVYSNNLIPVTIADNGTVTKADVTKEWYKYENKKWANAVILNDTGKIENDGTIKEESIESYFVWIPKYKYKLFDLGNYTSYISEKPEKSNAKEIDIVFGTDTTNDSNTGECTTPGISGETGNCEVGEYMTHSAFLAFNTTGLWVGKFETTGTIDNITVKPGITSIRSQTVKTMFESAHNYKRDNDSHMMKNTEWGAVAYLSHSKYGINKEVNINNNSDYLTGYSAIVSPTCFTKESSDCNQYGTTEDVTLPYNTITGYRASTTGNVTGIYDMSGGAHEYMASYIEGQLSSGGFEAELTNLYNSKYFELYNNNATVKTFNYRILGDATGETGPFYRYEDVDGNRTHNGWYNDTAHFIYTGSNWFARGGRNYHGINSGQLYFTGFTGESYNYIGFRLVLVN